MNIMAGMRLCYGTFNTENLTPNLNLVLIMKYSLFSVTVKQIAKARLPGVSLQNSNSIVHNKSALQTYNYWSVFNTPIMFCLYMLTTSRHTESFEQC